MSEPAAASQSRAHRFGQNHLFPITSRGVGKGMYFLYLWGEGDSLPPSQCSRGLKGMAMREHSWLTVSIPSYKVHFAGCAVSTGRNNFHGCSHRSFFIAAIEFSPITVAVMTLWLPSRHQLLWFLETCLPTKVQNVTHFTLMRGNCVVISGQGFA